MSGKSAVARKSEDAYHHGDLRAAFIAAALAQVEANGPEAVSISAIAKSLGVSQPAPYRHFADREALLMEVAAVGVARLLSRHDAALLGSEGGDRLAALAQSYVRVGTENPGLYRLIYASHLVERTPVGSPLQVAIEESFQWWLGAFGDLGDPVRREAVALQLWISLHGIVMLAHQGFLPLKTRRIREDQLTSAFVEDARRALLDPGDDRRR